MYFDARLAQARALQQLDGRSIICKLWSGPQGSLISSVLIFLVLFVGYVWEQVRLYWNTRQVELQWEQEQQQRPPVAQVRCFAAGKWLQALQHGSQSTYALHHGSCCNLQCTCILYLLSAHALQGKRF